MDYNSVVKKINKGHLGYQESVNSQLAGSETFLVDDTFLQIREKILAEVYIKCTSTFYLLIYFHISLKRTEKDWDNSLIIKRVLFEVFDCFLPLFYIAFYQLNVVALRRELVGLFWGDEIRRLITESLLPYVTEKSHVWKIKREYARAKKGTDEKSFIPSQVVTQVSNNDII